MPVPLLDVNAQNLPLADGLRAAFERVMTGGRFILGEEVEAFEHECARELDAPHAIAVSSGTDALLVALMALGIGPGDEVLCPAFSFFATAGCVARTGATPVFCDVCPETHNLDLRSASARLSPRTRAIVPVHLFGQSAEMEPLLEWAAGHGLAVVEDAAQAIGARHHGRACGTMGDFGCFSFFPSKNLGGFGDGGLVTTRDADRAEAIRRLRNHGMHPRYHHAAVGGNFRMDALQCALLRVKLPHLAEYAARRAEHASTYLELLALLPGVAAREDARLILPSVLPHNRMVWNQFTLRVPQGRRDSLKAHLGARGIGCEIYYPIPLHLQACFTNLPEPARQACPVAERLAGEVLSIPVYPELTTAQESEVIDSIASWLDSDT